MHSTEQTGARENESSTDDDITLIRIWAVVWRDKWLVVSLTALSGLLAIAYALMATEWYRADVLLVPARQDGMSGFGEQLSGLAALAGVTSAPSDCEQVRGDCSAAIEGVCPGVHRGQRPGAGLYRATLRSPASRVQEPADMRDAVRFFHENVLRVSEDRDTGHIALSVEWTDPAVASDWANALVAGSTNACVNAH